jgi:glycosyltransferase involved in cell wall biosynthesis
LKTLLLTSGAFTPKSTGICQTLENILDYMPADELVICSSAISSGPLGKYESYDYRLPAWTHKLPAFLRRWMEKRKISSMVEKLEKVKPDVVLIANLDDAPAEICYQLLQRVPARLYVYLLDNILEQPSEHVLWLMQKATGHIFISRYMAEANLERFPSITNYHIAHNPVPAEAISDLPLTGEPGPVRSIAYAGALWPMHYDAFLLIAGAVKQLRDEGEQVEFVTYTTSFFHDRLAKDFEQYSIRYGGFFSYSDLRPKLREHDALVVTSSMLGENYNLSAYSVQTKVTDYLAAGVPVLSIGPDYGACNRFLTEANAGFIITGNNTKDVAQSIRNFFALPAASRRQLVQNGLDLVRDKHSKQQIQADWKNFMK